MTTTRLGYDKKAYLHELYESRAPQSYLLLPQAHHRGNDTCFQGNPEYRPAAGKILNRNTPTSQITNIESDLRNLQRKSSKDPLTQYPFTKKQNVNPKVLPTCNMSQSLETKYTQLEAPSYKREMQIHTKRFESLDRNPQRFNRIHDNSYIGDNTRLKFRDSHVMKTPKVMDSTNVLSHINQKNGLHSFFNKNEVKIPWAKTCIKEDTKQ